MANPRPEDGPDDDAAEVSEEFLEELDRRAEDIRDGEFVTFAEYLAAREG